MAANTFREFIRLLEENAELRTGEREVSLHHELAALLRENEKRDNKALLFSRVRGYSIPVAGSLYSTTRRCLLGMGFDSMADFASGFSEAVASPLAPVIVGRDQSPVKQQIWTSDADLGRLPIPVHFQGDGGPYITAGVLMTQGGGNAGVYRCQVHGPRKLGVVPNKGKDLYYILKNAWKENRTVQVAVAVGVEPALFFAACWPTPRRVYEVAVAGALKKKAIELVKAETVDVMVPAEAEIVIEGIIHPRQLHPEGPFTDMSSLCSSVGPQPCIEITAMTTRNQPIFHTVLASDAKEHFKSRFSNFWIDYQAGGHNPTADLQEIVPTRYDVYFPPAAVNFHVYVAIEKFDDSDPSRIIDYMFAKHPLLKLVMIVDKDVNVRDPDEIQWALATRVGREEQVSLRKGVSSNLDVSGTDGTVLKVGIDATVPVLQREKITRDPA